MTLIVGIRGGKGAGKDSAAQYLKEKYGAVTWAVADSLKGVCMRLYGLQEDQLWGTQEEKEKEIPQWNASSRQLMERTGHALRCEFGEDMQVNQVIGQIWNVKPELAVISDVRFLNEANRIKLTGHGLLWRLHYPEGQAPATASGPESEWSQGDVDWSLRPKVKGLQELHALIDDACWEFSIKPRQGAGIPRCSQSHWFGTDPVGCYSWCVKPQGHLSKDHQDEVERSWTVVYP